MTTNYAYCCPKCGGTNLDVTVSTTAKLIQFGDGDFYTEVEGDHEWDGTSMMWCVDCHHADGSASFKTEESEETP